MHEAAPPGHRDVTVQGHDPVHPHPPPQGQVHRQQERTRRAADITGYGLLARARNHPQRPEDEEHFPREWQSSDHGLRALQCYQTVFWKQVSTKPPRRQPGYPGGLAVLPGAGAMSRPHSARLATSALLQGHRRIRIWHGMVRVVMRRVSVQESAAGGSHLAGREGRQAIVSQHASF